MDWASTLLVWGLTLGFMLVGVFAPVSLYARFLAIRREGRRQAGAIVPARDDGSTELDDEEPERNLLLDFENQEAQVCDQCPTTTKAYS